MYNEINIDVNQCISITLLFLLWMVYFVADSCCYVVGQKQQSAIIASELTPIKKSLMWFIDNKNYFDIVLHTRLSCIHACLVLLFVLLLLHFFLYTIPLVSINMF